MNELDERVAKLESSSKSTEGRVRALEHDVGVLQMHCASKVDLADAKAEILVKVAQSESALRTEIAQSESVLRTEIAQSENKLKTAIAQSENRLKTEISGAESKLRTEMGALEGRLRSEIAEVKAEVLKTKDRLLFWIVTIVIFGQILPSLLKQFAS